MNVHLDADRATELVYGLLDYEEKVQAHAHLNECPGCADQVRRMEDERSLIVEATAPVPLREERVRTLALEIYGRVRTIRRARTRRVWLVASAAALFLAAGAAFLARTRDIAEARSAVALGRVSVLTGGAWLAQADGYVPTPGDRIRTDDPAGASIRLEEGSRFNISRGSMVEFRGQRGPTAVLRLLEGEVHCQVVPDPRPFTVEAGGSTVTVVGTEFVVHMLDDQPFFRAEKRMPRPPKIGMIVTSGAVLFRNSEGEIRVPGGWVALSGAKGPPWIWGELKDLSKDLVLERMLRRAREVKAPADTRPIEAAWKERTDAAVKARVDAVPWARFADALVSYHKETDDAIREQRSILMVTTDLKVALELGWRSISLLAAELKVEGDFMQACRNRLAACLFVESIVEAMSGAPLTDEQHSKVPIDAVLENLLPVLDPAAPTLDRWKARVERTLAFVQQLKDVLPQSQFDRVTRQVGPSFLVNNFRVWLIEGATQPEAADRIARIWAEQFQLPTYVQPALLEIATRHVRDHLAAQEPFRRRAEPLTGVEELELSARLFTLQATAERSVAEIPSLNGEARARAAAGSSIFYRIRLGD